MCDVLFFGSKYSACIISYNPIVSLWDRDDHLPILQMRRLRSREVSNLHDIIHPGIGRVQSHLASLLCHLPRHRMQLRT